MQGKLGNFGAVVQAFTLSNAAGRMNRRGQQGRLLMVRTVLVAAVVTLGITAAFAQANVIEQRQSLMKQFGAATRTASGMLRGQTPFDLAQVQAALKTYSQSAKQATALFPDHSKTGETKALPAIWDNKADFDAIFAKLEQDAATALVAIKDEATFKSEMPKVLQNCGACHNKYQQKG
jgi:cytochrome c556